MTKLKSLAQAIDVEHLLKTSVSVLTLSALMAPVWAQTDTDDQDDQELALEEVVVMGQRASVISAQNIKRDSPQFVDSIVATDIGKLPDMNVAESLQRISGVQITRNMGEGSGIAIRGLTQVRTELNGRSSFTANEGRSLSFEDVPSELMAGVDVYKNPSAKMIEGGIGGTVDLRTFKPFDFDGRKISATVGSTYYDLIDEFNPNVSGLFSDRWDTGMGEMGFMVNLSYQETAFRQDTTSIEPYWERDAAEFGGTEGESVYVPAGGGINSSFGDRERLGVASAFQWRPNDDLDIYAQYIRSDYTMSLYDYSYFAFLPAEASDGGDNLVPFDNGDFSFNERGEMLTGSFAGVNIDSNTGLNKRHSITEDFAVGFEWQTNDNLNLSGDLQHVKATTEGENFILSVNAQAPVLDVDVTTSFPQMGVRPSDPSDPESADLANPDNYKWSWLIPHHQESDGSQTAARFDGEWEFHDGGFISSLSAGVRYSHREATTKSMEWTPWTTIDAPAWTCTDWATGGPLYPECNPDNLQPEDWSNQANWGETFPLDDPRFYNDDGSANWAQNQFTDFMRGSADAFGVTLAASSDLAGRFSDETVRFLTQNHPNPEYRLDGIPDYGPQQINDQEEDTLAAYGMVSFATELLSMPLDGNLGVRVVETQTTARGANASCDADGNNCEYYDSLFENEYTNTLPSLNLRWSLQENLYLRFAASKGISRPGFDQMDPNINLNVSVDNESGTITDRTASGGNPDLKPMEVAQADVALEWYFSDAGMAYATVFYKDVQSFIANGTVTRDFEYQNPLTGETETGAFDSDIPLNGEDGKIEGFEVGVSGFFDFLPEPWNGLGGQANYTYVDSEAPSPFATDIQGNALLVPLEGLSENSYNLVGMYEYGDWSVRLAYNWRDDYLVTTAGTGTGNLPIYNDAYGQLDGSINWTLNDTFTLQFDAVNITDSRNDTYQGSSSRYRDSYLGDRRYGVTLQAEF
ncbi:TonB-dependent receptor [Gilvimarinus sp. DA14]|uniref:TonB-dependent receptor n=1 Tax=Gilvimarinus sp. DA14 TaxID=2956798 RepID=UPI0020B84844|nr:TonB-dependent receptor [Gilvimarinus sp. DA14]UTF58889.1 TonB-dependent receptor [Gilvimarinus sp. DA14]